MIQNILKDKPTRLFLVLGGFFIANAMIAEFIGVKIFSLEDTLGVERAGINIFGTDFSFHLTAGVLLWPVVFIMTDVKDNSSIANIIRIFKICDNIMRT